MSVLRSAMCVLVAALLLLPAAVAAKDAYDYLDEAATLGQQGRIDAAVATFRKVLDTPVLRKQLPKEHLGQTHFNLGYTLMQGGRLQAAMDAFDAAVAVIPSQPEPFLKAAWCANQLGTPGRAVWYLREATKLPGAPPTTWALYGDMLNNIMRFSEAIDAYAEGMRAIHAVEQEAQAQQQRKGRGGRGAAQAAGDAAAGIPRDPRARQLLGKLHSSTGDALTNLKRSSEALAHYAAAKRLTPTDPDLLATSMHARQEECQWEGYDEEVEQAVAASMARVNKRGRQAQRPADDGDVPVSSVTPYQTLFIEVPAPNRTALIESVALAMQKDAAAAAAAAAAATAAGRAAGSPDAANFAALEGQLQQALPTTGAPLVSRPASEPLPVVSLTYISRRFEDYPGTHLLQGLFPRHDRVRAAVHCFASGPDDNSTARELVRHNCDTFADVSLKNAPDTAATLVAVSPYVILDYDGHHDFNNIRALAARPALVQASWLGFAGTTGFRRPRRIGSPARGAVKRSGDIFSLPPIDTAIVDAVIAPVETASRSMMTERLVYLPSSYQPQDPDQPLAGPRPRFGGAVEDDTRADAAQRPQYSDLRVRLQREEGLVLPPPASGQRSSDDAHISDDGVLAVEHEEDEAPVAAGHAVSGVSASSSANSGADDVLVFATFNRWGKIDPRVWTVWMNILARVPRAVLWVYGGLNDTCVYGAGDLQAGDDGSACAATGHIATLWYEAAARGVHPARIVFARKAPRDRHLYRHFAADVMLDTRLYGAHTTAADGFFSGLPLVTMAGEAFASRVGSSLVGGFAQAPAAPPAPSESPADALTGVSAIHLQVVHSLSEYEDTAARLGALPVESMEAVRQSLHERVVATCELRGATCGEQIADGVLVPAAGAWRQWSGLFDATGFVSGLEAAAAAAYESSDLFRRASPAAESGLRMGVLPHVVVVPGSR